MIDGAVLQSHEDLQSRETVTITSFSHDTVGLPNPLTQHGATNNLPACSGMSSWHVCQRLARAMPLPTNGAVDRHTCILIARHVAFALARFLLRLPALVDLWRGARTHARDIVRERAARYDAASDAKGF